MSKMMDNHRREGGQIVLPDKMTIGECYGPAMEITDQEPADEYFNALVERHMRAAPKSRDEAEHIERTNIGYYAGYGFDRERVERLFKCAHPFFGQVAINGPPSAETALNIGRSIGRR